MTLTPETLDELLRLREAGTQGDWGSNAVGDVGIRYNAKRKPSEISFDVVAECRWPNTFDNAALIAAAVNALPALVAAARERDALRAALGRQSDNMAFVVNNVGLPDRWYEKLKRELEEDRAALEYAMSDVRCAECDCTDGNCNWIMTDEPDMRPMDWVEVAARAHEEGRRKGLEQAAAWLDDEAFAYDAVAVGPVDKIIAARLRNAAASLRAMKDKP